MQYLGRIVEVANCGKHSVLVRGIPQGGKSYLIQRMLNDVPHIRVSSTLALMRALDSDASCIWITNDNAIASQRVQRAAAQRLTDSPKRIILERSCCDCGYWGDTRKPCLCPVESIEQFRLYAGLAAQFQMCVALTRDEPVWHSDATRDTGSAVLEWHSDASALLDICGKRFSWSRTQIQAAMRVAETIARMDNSDVVTVVHMAEAAQYRLPDYV